MKKTPFVTKQQVEEIVKKFPTPFHLYDEAGIRANAQAVKDAFAWNPGFREYFAVKATPNPYLLKILKDYDMGCDCSSYTELMLAKSCGFDGEHIMFSSNDTPAEEFAYADKLGAIINLDDFTHIDFLEETIGHIPETISCRYNPGGVFTLSNGIMDNPGDSKYGMTKEQLFEAFKILKSKGAKYFGVHAFLASNTVTNEYYPQLAKELFELVVELKNETGCDIRFVNLSGGVGVAYKPDQTPNDISVIGAGVHKVYDEVLVPAGMGDVAIYTEMGRFMMAPYGCLVTKAIHEKHIYKEYSGLSLPGQETVHPHIRKSHPQCICSLPAALHCICHRDCHAHTKEGLQPSLSERTDSSGLSLHMIQEHTASRWATIITDDFAQQRYCSKAMERQNSSEEQKLRQTTLQPLTALMILK
jgi:diaminopimelate decarboxylase